MAKPHMRIESLRSAVEAAGVAMAPASDQFLAAEPAAPVDAGNYSRSWAAPRFKPVFSEPRAAGLFQWLSVRRARAMST